ncbi:class I SAM-dependent methyltransferase [Cyclobacterium sp.]|uniref:class I SAM-dependent methyltransferase n=1 Tax=Cyclobacterium sp. TaxID=1966343 RepID=UPI0025BEF5FA|nr:class I SAM-dependent methyltransferase [Cyclobacterium sp.]
MNKDYPVKFIEKIATNQVISKYRDDFNVDISSYFEGLDFVEIYECIKTKYRFFYPFYIIGDEFFYKDLSSKKINYYHERWEHKIALNYATEGENWLEIGSGNSSFLKELSKMGVVATGLEFNREEAAKPDDRKFQVINTDFFSFSSEDFKYDTIALFQVLEHIQDISLFFKHTRKLLKDEGKLIISVPNNNPYLYVFEKLHTLNLPPHHMGLWTGDSLAKVGDLFGFKMLHLRFEPLSQYELNYILNLPDSDKWSIRYFKFYLLKKVRKILPNTVFNIISYWYRSSLVKGRNLIIIFQKND